MLTTNGKADVTEAERGSVGLGTGIFTRAKKEEKGDADHVGYGEVCNGEAGQGCKHDVLEDSDRNGLYSVGGRILLLVVSELSLETEIHAALGCLAWIRGPHCRERLGNAAYGILSGAAADGALTVTELTSAVSVEKDL